MYNCQIIINSKKDIKLFINKLLTTIDYPFCICLIGPLGVGKTYFSQYLIKKLLNTQINVSSPTFSLVNIYDFKNTQQNYQIWHCDLYRINHEEEVLHLGLDNNVLSKNIVIIEWANRLKTLYPKNAITIQLEFTKDGKRLLKTNYQYS